jgi:hypothetical protein
VAKKYDIKANNASEARAIVNRNGFLFAEIQRTIDFANGDQFTA